MKKKTSTASSRQKTPGPTPDVSADASDLQAHVGFWLRFVSNHVSAGFRKRVEAEGVSVSEWVALRQIYGAGVTTHAALMDALGMTKGAVSKIVSRLQQKHLVERVFTESDLRAQQLMLTPAGKALVPKLAGLADTNDDIFFGHLDQIQRQALIALMQDIVRRHQLRQVPVE